MHFSVWMRAYDPWTEMAHQARHIDRTGWRGIWVADHFMPMTNLRGDGPRETWAVLAAIAAVTERVRLGNIVCGNTYRHPAILANTAATVDVISNGRVILGLGAAWDQNEHDAYGIELPPVRVRLDRLEEACQVIKAITGTEPGSFTGEHYQVTNAFTGAHPVNAPLPLLVGGHGEKRTLNITARFADEWNAWCPPDEMKRLGAVLDRHCEDVGRDPSSVKRTAMMVFAFEDDPPVTAGPPAQLVGTASALQDVMHAYADAGVNEILVPDWAWGTGQRRIDGIDRFFEEVAAPFRD
jgi:F420-dependent oxidoreductase-like protein